MTRLQLRQYSTAKKLLHALLQQQPTCLFYTIAMAQVEFETGAVKESVNRLQTLYKKEPSNYALIMDYAKTLGQAKQFNEAMFVYLKGSRVFPKDLLLCKKLARAQAEDNNTAYAYFTQGQCMILQGKIKEAIYQLQQAKKYQTKDSYIQARITAKIEELKQD